MFEVYRGQRPGRPDNSQCFVELNDVMWGVITQAWAQDPLARPNMAHIHGLLCQVIPNHSSTFDDPPARQVPRDHRDKTWDKTISPLDHLLHQRESIFKPWVSTRDSELMLIPSIFFSCSDLKPDVV
jgi:hypothetical protein